MWTIKKTKMKNTQNHFGLQVFFVSVNNLFSEKHQVYSVVKEERDEKEKRVDSRGESGGVRGSSVSTKH